jgi:hypothetical protein
MAAHPDSSDDDNNAKVPAPAETSEDEKQEARKELEQAIRGSHEVLMSATTVWPFTPFPDTVTVDRVKITIMHRTFFKVAEIVSIRVEDVLNVTANVGPMFGSLHIVSRVLSPDKPYEVNFLWRDDALHLKRIIQGYVIAIQKKIDVTPLSAEELAKMLNELSVENPTPS